MHSLTLSFPTLQELHDAVVRLQGLLLGGDLTLGGLGLGVHHRHMLVDVFLAGAGAQAHGAGRQDQRYG